MVNPDGGEYDLTGDPYRAWRKNRQPNAGSSTSAPTSTATTATAGAAAAARRARSRRARIAGRAAFSAPETRAMRDFMDSRGRRWSPADPRRHHVPHGRRAGPLAVRLHEDRRPGRHDRRRPRRAASRSAGRWPARNGYTPMQSSSLYITDGDEIDWAYGRQRIFMYTFELYPPRRVSSTAASTRPTSSSAARPSATRRRSCTSSSAAGCRTRSIGKTQTHCGPLFDDFEAPRAGRRPARRPTPRPAGAWQRANPARHDLPGGDRDVRARGRSSPAAGRARRRTRTTSTAA